MFAIKEEVISRENSEHGEEEMEVDSDEQDEEARSQGVPTRGQIPKSINPGGTFNTLSSLSSLKPGRTFNSETFGEGLW